MRRHAKPILAVLLALACVPGIVVLASPATGAGEPTSVRRAVAPFDAIEVHGGMEADVRSGARPSVVLHGGAHRLGEVSTDVADGTLSLGHDFTYDIFGASPGDDVDAVATTVRPLHGVEIHGGGTVRASGATDRLTVVLHGGGDAALAGLRAAEVRVEIHGGGTAEVHATRTLHAEVHGGGEVFYSGHPQVTRDIHGGGEVHAAG